MARQLHEIKSFNTGTVSNADNKDIPDESTVFSYGVDGNAPGGVIVGKAKDVPAFDLANNSDISSFLDMILRLQ